MEHNSLFSYYWYIDEKEENVTSIRIYGLSQDNKNICVIVNDFTPYVYIELPDEIPWDTTKAQYVSNKLEQMLGEHKPIKKSLMMKNVLIC